MPDITNGVAPPAPPPVLTRTVTPTVPVTVTYEVTDLGRYPRPARSMPPRPLSDAVPTIQFATKGAGTCGPTVYISSRR